MKIDKINLQHSSTAHLSFRQIMDFSMFKSVQVTASTSFQIRSYGIL